MKLRLGQGRSGVPRRCFVGGAVFQTTVVSAFGVEIKREPDAGVSAEPKWP